MTSRGFLNVAHASLVEEFMRPKIARGVTIPGLSLVEALDAAAPWAEGYRAADQIQPQEQEERVEQIQVAAPASGNRSKSIEEMSEEEVVAQNEQALSWLKGRMKSVKGGFSTR